MAEPRARVARHKGQMNFASDLRALLSGYGDRDAHPYCPQGPLPETVRVLDEMVTDFILEMCHQAASCAHYARRQKIKVDDFRFALRRDPIKLGRVQELLRMDRELKDARKIFDQDDDQVTTGKKAVEDLDVSVDETEGTTAAGKKSKGKGKRVARRGSDATEDTVSKKRRVNA
ncbi:putative transcription initiation factor TFIID subunit 13 [Talaromyces proteolyticus]|uniref:Transcription initiation factor TFIID subunit 13 n=1 Tax=Talaromyces proteolyticus TaxID=1131652 RepID=A0AAD4KTW4_9EURO|nr:putative transcription initiation factor TFIID subunit 13 [Talaromyces proteolyticus]KAH8697015.1 putative transcription initiation factor TFIID subunit 13 [Talaromyces proteolyticus]